MRIAHTFQLTFNRSNQSDVRFCFWQRRRRPAVTVSRVKWNNRSVPGGRTGFAGCSSHAVMTTSIVSRLECPAPPVKIALWSSRASLPLQRRMARLYRRAFFRWGGKSRVAYVFKSPTVAPQPPPVPSSWRNDTTCGCFSRSERTISR